MKSTGVIRRIDDLGRFVIPKEIRRNLHIGQGDYIEIYIEDDAVVLQKFEYKSDIKGVAEGFVKQLEDYGYTYEVVDAFKGLIEKLP
ncbi:MAG: AbrB/MazE/SpoVT family DNA-binding domain-containing protein [Clostridiales bacterium]|nr:AbrB/MazE/SpoVT family DNA-binding domain-containing protein [Clostridiales bacterium]